MGLSVRRLGVASQCLFEVPVRVDSFMGLGLIMFTGAEDEELPVT